MLWGLLRLGNCKFTDQRSQVMSVHTDALTVARVKRPCEVFVPLIFLPPMTILF